MRFFIVLILLVPFCSYSQSNAVFILDGAVSFNVGNDFIQLPSSIKADSALHTYYFESVYDSLLHFNVCDYSMNFIQFNLFYKKVLRQPSITDKHYMVNPYPFFQYRIDDDKKITYVRSICIMSTGKSYFLVMFVPQNEDEKTAINAAQVFSTFTLK